MSKNSETFIEDALFEQIIAHTPLVSLDLVVKKGSDVLLGRRVNKPAQGYWFTIGGRIHKGETISETITRIAAEELGVALKAPVTFIGVFEHLYEDGIYEGISTHYLNLVYEAQIDDLPRLPRDQHDAYWWFTVSELLESDAVHPYVKDIFRKKIVPR